MFSFINLIIMACFGYLQIKFYYTKPMETYIITTRITNDTQINYYIPDRTPAAFMQPFPL